MGATIAYMFQLHCYDICFLRCTHPWSSDIYMHGLALLLRDHHRCIIQRSGCDRCDTDGFGRHIIIDQSNTVDYNRGYQLLFYGSRFTMLLLLDGPYYARTCGRGFRGNPRPVIVFNSSSRKGTPFASNISKGFSFVDKVSVPISDNIKRNNMLPFANRPELMNQYTTSSKYAGVQRHSMMLDAQLFLLLHSRQDLNKAYYFRSENQTEPPSMADRRSP